MIIEKVKRKLESRIELFTLDIGNYSEDDKKWSQRLAGPLWERMALNIVAAR
jgi:hypothetical protein